MNISIFIAFHKKYPLLTNDLAYVPLHVGKSLSPADLGFSGDNSGENISGKNQNYSELTGLYWILKNVQSECVGLCHYRRFFFRKPPTPFMRLKKMGESLIGQGKKRFGIYYSSNFSDTELILSGNEIADLMANYDAIIPMARKMKYSVRTHYNRRHFIKDLELTELIISELYPTYLPAFNEVMLEKELFTCNMFIMKQNYLNEYLEWLFAILFELEKRIDLSSYDNYQKRIFGFISERLIAVWLKQKDIRTIELPVLYFKHLKV